MIARLLSAAFALATISACVSLPPTHYSEGLKVEDGVSTFQGNSRTSSDTAQLYSKIGAIVSCMDKQMVALLSDSEDLTTKFNDVYTSTSTYQQPTYTSYQGKTYTSYNGPVRTTTTSIPYTVYYPSYKTYFTCVPRVFLSGFDSSENLPSGTVNKHTGDYLGAVLIKEPDIGSGLKANDVLIKANGKRVVDLPDLFVRTLPRMKAGSKRYKALLIRDGKLISVNVKTADLTSTYFLISNMIFISAACQKNNDPTFALCRFSNEEWSKVFYKYGIPKESHLDYLRTLKLTSDTEEG